MKCVHCLSDAGTTRDHVFPKSWYTDDTPITIQRPTVPSCGECNGKLGAAEDQLFQKLGVCIDPNKAAASGIKSKVLSSFGIGVNQNRMSERDRRARFSRAQKLMEQTRPFLGSGMRPFPGLGPHKGYPLELQKGFPVPTDELERVSMKIVKGLEYWLAKRYVEPPLEAEVFLYVEEEIAEVEQLLNRGTQHVFGPGFDVRRASGDQEVLYKILIWDTLRVYGSVGLAEQQ